MAPDPVYTRWRSGAVFFSGLCVDALCLVFFLYPFSLLSRIPHVCSLTRKASMSDFLPVCGGSLPLIFPLATCFIGLLRADFRSSRFWLGHFFAKSFRGGRECLSGRGVLLQGQASFEILRSREHSPLSAVAPARTPFSSVSSGSRLLFSLSESLPAGC